MEIDTSFMPLGNLISACDLRNADGALKEDSVRGISIQKAFIPTKANLDGVSLTSYKIVEPGQFAYVTVTSRNGGKISLAYNNANEQYLVSGTYQVFRVSSDKLLPEYLHLFFCRPEFDRYARFNSWGSARETFDWQDMQRVLIPIPDIETQQRLVDVWGGLDRMKQDGIAQAAPLMELCMSYLKSLSGKYQERLLADYIEQTNERNSNGAISDVRGLSTKKEFREPQSRVNRKELHGYKVLHPHEFAFVPTTDTWRCLAAALSEFDHPIVVSPIYCTFRITRPSELLPEFLMLMYLRPDFDRYARYHSWGSARENFSFEDMQRVKITIPPLSIQQSVVDLYTCAKESRDIAKHADALWKLAGPALMQKAVYP